MINKNKNMINYEIKVTFYDNSGYSDEETICKVFTNEINDEKLTKILNKTAYIAYEDMAIARYKTFSDEYKSTVKFEEFLEDCDYIMEAYET